MGKSSKSHWSSDELIGGHLSLDFVNTAGGRTKRRDRERLVDFEALLRWSEASGMLHFEECRALRSRRFSEVDRDAELHQLRQFREALHGCLMAEQSDTDWPVGAAVQVRREIASALSGSTLVRDDEGYCWHCELDTFGLALPRARSALAAEALLRSDQLRRLRNCDRCSWLFIDRGRGRPRRWCSMATCGSRAKSARYYRRHRDEL